MARHAICCCRGREQVSSNLVETSSRRRRARTLFASCSHVRLSESSPLRLFLAGAMAHTWKGELMECTGAFRALRPCVAQRSPTLTRACQVKTRTRTAAIGAAFACFWLFAARWLILRSSAPPPWARPLRPRALLPTLLPRAHALRLTARSCQVVICPCHGFADNYRCVCWSAVREPPPLTRLLLFSPSGEPSPPGTSRTCSSSSPSRPSGSGSAWAATCAARR